jgi:hypothetical protein
MKWCHHKLFKHADDELYKYKVMWRETFNDDGEKLFLKAKEVVNHIKENPLIFFTITEKDDPQKKYLISLDGENIESTSPSQSSENISGYVKIYGKTLKKVWIPYDVLSATRSTLKKWILLNKDVCPSIGDSVTTYLNYSDKTLEIVFKRTGENKLHNMGQKFLDDEPSELTSHKTYKKKPIVKSTKSSVLGKGIFFEAQAKLNLTSGNDQAKLYEIVESNPRCSLEEIIRLWKK